MSRYVGIDTSTKTGITIIDEYGDVWDATEIHREGSDPDRMICLLDSISGMLQDDDLVCIEDFAYAQANKMAMIGGIGWGVRMILRRRGIKYHEVSTGQLKNFANCKGNCAKEDMIIPIYDLWGFKGRTDNIRDAFVLAQICRALHEPVKLFKYQEQVIQKVKGRG